MYIHRLLVENLRNLSAVAIADLAEMNFFIGPNGAGKTSVLEAIAIASQGRSFRNTRVQTVIRHGESSLQVFLECEDDNQVCHKLGIQRDRQGAYLVRIDGMTAASLAELSLILPVVVLDANAFELLDGAATTRRRFIDWGVFHVERGFYEKWKALVRALKQRNALLRSRNDDYNQYLPWDLEIATLAVDIENCRRRFLGQYVSALQSTIAALDSELAGCALYYRNGWGHDRIALAEPGALPVLPPAASATFLADLREMFERDCRYQRTHIGPHRADMQLTVQRQDARDVYSRGQKKTLIAAMKLAQALVVKTATARHPVLLLDDLPSELDRQHLNRFLDFVSAESFQSFITGVDGAVCSGRTGAKSRMFHVERGKIEPVNAQGDSQA